MKRFYACMFALLLAFAFVVPAFPAGELPVQDLKQGGFADSAVGGSAVVAPFIKILNGLIGVLSAIFLAYAIFHLVLKVKDLIAGKRTVQGMMPDFVSIGVAIIILAISLAGGWYDLIGWLYNNIIVKVLSAFGG